MMESKEADKRFVWHPFTQMSEWFEETSPLIVAADGYYLIDSDGNRYIDGVSSLWCTVLGHRNPHLDGALLNQIRKFAHSTLLGLASEPAAKLAEKLVSITPQNLTRVFFSDNGSTAVEVALKVFFRYHRLRDPTTKKRLFLCFENGYHGDTVGAVSVGGIQIFHDDFGQLTFPTVRAPSPYCYRCSLNLVPESCGLACADVAVELIHKNADALCGVVVEPKVQCAGGMIVQPDGWLARIKAACTEMDVPLIADEVAVGFGRTGRMFGCEHDGVTPSAICLAKALTAGYLPLAATLFEDQVFNAFLGEYRKTFFHGHTFTGNALGCAVALAALNLYTQPDFLPRIRHLAALLADLLEVFKNHPNVGDIRCCGFLAGVELVRDRKTKEPFSMDERVCHKITLAARKYGVITRPLGNVLVFMPPYVINEDGLERLVEGVWRATSDVLPFS